MLTGPKPCIPPMSCTPFMDSNYRRERANQRALQILNSVFWVSGHRRYPRVTPSDEDFAYARDAGLMFDPVTIEHDQLPLRIRSLVRRMPLHDVVEAFVSSLSSRRLDLGQCRHGAWQGDASAPGCRRLG